MEKIIVTTGSKEDDNLIKCLRILFPECMIEVHERRPRTRVESPFAAYNPENDIFNQRLDPYPSFS